MRSSVQNPSSESQKFQKLQKRKKRIQDSTKIKKYFNVKKIAQKGEISERSLLKDLNLYIDEI